MTFNQHGAAEFFVGSQPHRPQSPQSAAVSWKYPSASNTPWLKCSDDLTQKRKKKVILVTTGELINYAEPKITVPQSINSFNDAASVGGDTATSGGKKQYSASKMTII